MTGAEQGEQSTPNWRRTRLQYPHNAKTMKDQKRKTDTKEAKKCFGQGMVGNFAKKTTNTSMDAEFSPIIRILAFSYFHRAPYHWTTMIPSYGFFNRAEKKIWVLWRVLGYYVHSTFSG